GSDLPIVLEVEGMHPLTDCRDRNSFRRQGIPGKPQHESRRRTSADVAGKANLSKRPVRCVCIRQQVTGVKTQPHRMIASQRTEVVHELVRAAEISPRVGSASYS